jgi:hypothetical protein
VRGTKDFYISHEPHEPQGLVIRYRGFIFVWFAARAQAKAFALLVCKTAALMRATACGVLTLPPLNAARLFAGFVGNLFFRDKEEDFCS